MKPSVESILQQSTGLKADAVRQHLDRLPEAYYSQFPLESVAEHVRLLQGLADRNPADVIFHKTGEDTATCTVLAFDYPGEFSVISGLLAGYGFSIQSGHVYTYASSVVPERSGPHHRRPRKAGLIHRRCIVDHFSGRVGERLQTADGIEELCTTLRQVIGLLEQGDHLAVEKAKRIVNGAVVSRLEHLQHDAHPMLYPMEVDFENASAANATRLRVVSQDTPAFLYALSTTLAMQNLSIEHLRIRTVLGRIEDEIEIVDRSGAGRSLADLESQNRIRLTVLLTKQFTYFLPAAPDPFAALSRFEHLVSEILQQPNQDSWLKTISDPHAMRDLARVFGASDFLWEDFIRLQYESLLPCLQPHVEKGQLSTPPEKLPDRLEEALTGCGSLESRIAAINHFKDHEIFLIDLDHILHHDLEFRELSCRLSWLAELVVERVAQWIFDDLQARHGRPQTVGGLTAHYAVMGLGKLGGVSLGYASDIELLFIYSDAGETNGSDSISNAEFFSALARESSKAIAAKREGIFEVDLRLRPHGKSGPLACSLESFCRYYGPGGAALSYERLALVRMRWIAGDAGLGQRLERLRDEFVYGAREIKLQEIHELRARQAREKGRPGAYNAKFSPGALVDLEYTVQLLQVEYGAAQESLRTPSLHTALEALREIGVLEPDELERLIGAYDFLRRLINGLRMLRGSARDLFLPGVDSDEFLHLARRMGYGQKDGLTAAEQLHLDYETRTAAVRAFVEKHYGRESIPGPVIGNVADVLLSPGMDPDAALEVVRGAGFDNPEQALVNLRSLAGEGRRREAFVSLAVLACDHLKLEPAPSMALNNWERYVTAVGNPLGHFELLLAQPRRLDILLGIFSRSQFLANTLIQHPEYLNWVTDPQTLHGIRSRKELEVELSELAAELDNREEWIAALCRLRKREILRIGTRDMILKAPIDEITRDLSVLAEAILQAALLQAWKRLVKEGKVPNDMTGLIERFYMLGLGKLGGEELNYSSDIDLVAGCDLVETDPNFSGTGRVLLKKWLYEMHEDLTRHTPDGYAYRIDFRLRPYGSSGDWVQTSESMFQYYEQQAALWEVQALLKARVVAGNVALGEAFLKRLESVLLQPRSAPAIVESIQHMRSAAVQHVARPGTRDVKTGIGGIRDIEFMVQGYQLKYAEQFPGLLGGNTLRALDRLDAQSLIRPEPARQLVEHYVFLRRVEHFLQILDDRQIHAIPSDEDELDRLARRVLGPSAAAAQLVEELNRRALEVRKLYEEGMDQLLKSKNVI